METSLKHIVLICILLMGSFSTIAQSDTLNQIDDSGKKQGYWIYYGKDRPESGYPPNGKIEEGRYVNDRKEGIWIKYYEDGVTPRFKGEYHNNRPSGHYWKGNRNGTTKEEGIFDRRKNTTTISRGDLLETVSNQYSADSLMIVYEGKSMRNCEELPVELYKDSCVCKSKPTGFQQAYNENDDVIFVGDCKDGKPWDGKFYYYDDDGILMKVEIWKNGEYHSDGHL